MKWFWCLLCCLTINLSVMAQIPPNRKQQIEAIKIAFITEKLDLTTDEAQHFWPVYNNYQRDLQEIFKLRHQSKLNKVNDPENELNAELDFEERILDLKKKYKREFTKVLPVQKVLLLYKAEREFREQLIKQLRERRKK